MLLLHYILHSVCVFYCILIWVWATVCTSFALCICWNTSTTRGRRSKMSPCCILFPSIRRTDRFTQLLKALAKLVRHGWALKTFATFILFSLQKIGEKEKLYFFFFCLFQYKTWMKCQAWLTKKAGLKSLIFSSLPPTRNCVKLNSKIESFPKAILVTMRKRKRRGRRNPN